MDRSPPTNGFIWVGVTLGALLLPACADDSSPDHELRVRSCPITVVAAAGEPIAVGPAEETQRVSSGLSGAVVAASHLFPPPPSPGVNVHEVEVDSTKPIYRDQSVVRLVPEPEGERDTLDAPRRLPEPDAQLLSEAPSNTTPRLQAEPRLRLELGGEAAPQVPEACDTGQLHRLPPPPVVDDQRDLFGTYPPGASGEFRRLPAAVRQTQDFHEELRRLPPPPSDELIGAAREIDAEKPVPGDHLSEAIVTDEAVADGDDSNVVEPLAHDDAGIQLLPPMQRSEEHPELAGTRPDEQEDTIENDALSSASPNSFTPREPAEPTDTPPALPDPVTAAADSVAEQTTRDVEKAQGPSPSAPGPRHTPHDHEPGRLDEPNMHIVGSIEDVPSRLPAISEVTTERANPVRLSPPIFAPDERASDELRAEVGVLRDGDPALTSAFPIEGRALSPPDTPPSPVVGGVKMPACDPAGAAHGSDARIPAAWRVVTSTGTPEREVVAQGHDAQAFQVIARRVSTLSQRAEDLASRGACYAARAEMIKALRAITQGLDTQLGVATHSQALARAMRALQEAGDFAPRGSQLEAELNLTHIVSGHRTTILKNMRLENVSPLAAQRLYLDYAQEQLAVAGGRLPAASYALYGLARIYTVSESAQLEAQTLCLPIAVTLHRAALMVDASNARAANELGVLLARCGQFEDARRVLQHALTVRPEPEIWHNVAIVHQRLGQSELARQAYQQYELATSPQLGDPHATPVNPVQWVDPQTFSQVRSALAP